MTIFRAGVFAASASVVLLASSISTAQVVYSDSTTPKAGDGHSVGHWEGDTLVVETVRLRAAEGPPWLGEGATVVERFRMVNKDALASEVTITDPGSLTGVWAYDRFCNRAPKGTEIEEYVCTNNRALSDATGVQTAR